MPTKTANISKVANVIIPVKNQERMLGFYSEKIGLEKRTDIPFNEEGDRWIELAPSGAETPVVICPPGPNGEAGGRETGITLQTDDIDAYHARLKQGGVDVDAEVSRFGGPVPPIFWFRDPEGNKLMVVEVQ